MKQHCREAIKSRNMMSNLNVEDLIEAITPKARARSDMTDQTLSLSLWTPHSHSWLTLTTPYLSVPSYLHHPSALCPLLFCTPTPSLSVPWQPPSLPRPYLLISVLPYISICPLYSYPLSQCSWRGQERVAVQDQDLCRHPHWPVPLWQLA